MEEESWPAAAVEASLPSGSGAGQRRGRMGRPAAAPASRGGDAQQQEEAVPSVMTPQRLSMQHGHFSWAVARWRMAAARQRRGRLVAGAMPGLAEGGDLLGGGKALGTDRKVDAAGIDIDGDLETNNHIAIRKSLSVNPLKKTTFQLPNVYCIQSENNT
uniref:Uncharacterized protein n=1 Tax=Oryza glumipatula TaxID=40148 RepID=A0A0E0AHR7_9ORYZ